MSQPLGVLKHFSHDERLSQSRILDIKQDDKGFIWLATFNGLIRYDGSTFKNFKVIKSNSLNLKSNRVYNFEFDKDDRIWIQSENNEVYYFDTHSLSFHHPLENNSENQSDLFFNKFIITPSGKVWLIPEKETSILRFDRDKHVKRINLKSVKLSSEDIFDIFEDSAGNTWFLTKYGICRIDESDSLVSDYYFFNNTSNQNNSLFFNCILETNDEIWFGGLQGKILRFAKKTNTFLDFKLDIEGDIVRMESVSNNKIVFFTKNKGVNVFNTKSKKLESFNSKTIQGFPKDSLVFLGITKGDNLWFESTGLGVYQFNLSSKKINYLKIQPKDDTVTNIDHKTLLLTAPDGTVWVQPKGGALSCWNGKTNKLYSVLDCIRGNGKVVSDVMYTAMFDKLGNLWFCSFKQGLDLLVFNNNFSKLNLSTTQESQKNNVRSLMSDNRGNLWVASRSHKITILDSKKNIVGQLGCNGSLEKNSPNWGADIYSMMQDQKGNVWVGTRGNGLFCLIPTNQSFVYNVRHFKNNPNDVYSLSSNHIYDIFQASSGIVYVATWGGGINIIQPSKGGIQFINYKNELKNYPIKFADRVRAIVEYENNKLFFITPYELFSFSNKNAQFNKFQFTKYPQVSGSDILDMLVTKDSRLALATNGRGLILADFIEENKPKVYVPLEEMIGFPIEGIMALQEDNLGNIWLMGENQVVRFDLNTNAAETFPELKSLIGTDIISEASKCQLKNGQIVIGYSNGAICFNPNTIKPPKFNPHLSISSFSVYNKELQDINSEVIKNPDLLNEVTLKHNQNFFRIHLSTLDYFKNENIVYKYKLEGIETQWNYFKGSQSINYTNLGKGKYKLIMASTNSHNLWVDNERTLDITILPSIWNTTLAYVCYIIIALILLFLIQRTILTILKLRNDVHVEKQMAELKLKFFTDISHEIRTPLTMITAPVEKMIADEETPNSIKKELLVIERNSNRLLNLVNQILDLRRIQNRKLDIRGIQFANFISTICKNFKDISQKRKIKLELHILAENPTIWADYDSLDKIILNLLSNAFKYCKEGDTIEVILEETEKNLNLKIKDNGPGISAEVQKRLFLRFSNYNVNPSNPSTGIGLSIVKGLVEKHGGTVSVSSQIGKGTCFQLSFLKGYQHFNDDVDIVFENFETNEEVILDENELVIEFSEKSSESKKVGLLVEDDKELRNFIASVLEKNYIIHEAENGLEGHAKALKYSPDFIISDVMMPKMDGIELLQLIRNNPDTSHIPFVLLSAKTSIESRLEGLEYGADEYLTKPFNVSYLKVRIKNLLDQRRQLQILYSNGDVNALKIEEQQEPLKISNKDHKFMLKVIALVEENMMKTDFSVEELGNLMNMSRASFFNKLKALSGISPVKFIRDMKLNKAAELIINEDLLIKEICFQVGFNDLKYFGKCFKEKFNCTPAEYRRNKSK